MNANKVFNELYARVKTKENYVPRDYQTIGGFWTVDTWVKNNVTAKLMDEGCTRVIMTNDLIVTQQYDYQKRENYLIFEKGDEDLLKETYNKFV